MTIREKSLLIGGATILVLVGAIHLLSRTMLLDTFDELDLELAQESVQQLINGISSEVELLSNQNSDWSGWDATYSYMEDGNAAYIEENLGDNTFRALNLQLIAYIQPNGLVRWGQMFDPQSGARSPLPHDLMARLQPNHPLVTHTSTTNAVAGLASVGGRTLLIASRPVLTSQDQGPIRGSLIMGRQLTDQTMEKYTRMTGVSAQVQTWTDAMANPDKRELLAQVRHRDGIAVRVYDSVILELCARLNDFEGMPCAALIAWRQRNVFNMGLYALRQFTVLLCVGGLLIGLAAFLVLEREVLFPVRRLHQRVAHIHASNDLAQRFSVSGNDELSGLAQEMNNLLARLQAALAEIESVNRELEEKVRSRTHELEVSRVELMSLYRHIEHVREQERRQLAERVHDDLGQMITALKMGVAWIRRQLEAPAPAVSARIEEVLSLTDSLTRGVQDLAADLRPSILDHLGLSAAVEWSARRFVERSGLACDFRVQPVVISQESATILFRIFQELLTNIARHAQARHVSIVLRQDVDVIVLRVVDDGRGIRDHETRGVNAFGLSEVRERVSILNGKLSIEGLPQRGTTIEVRIPIVDAAMKSVHSA